MKANIYIKTILALILFYNNSYADIAPNPIEIKSILTSDSCKIRMVSEIVVVDLYKDSAKVDCTFELTNYGDSTTIDIGFPEMNFQYWSIGEYSEFDKKNFQIFVNENLLTEKDISVAKKFENVYRKYMFVFEADKECKKQIDSIYTVFNVKKRKNGTLIYNNKQESTIVNKAVYSIYKLRKSKPYLGSDLWREYDSLMKTGVFPWYVWKVRFKSNEKKTISVKYNLPSGMGKGANYRYFKYLLNTGSGWYRDIEKADVILNLKNIKIENIEEVLPKNYSIDFGSKTIKWNFKKLEPTTDNDIYFRYFDLIERTKYYQIIEKRKKKRE